MQADNPYINDTDALQKGKEALARGDLATAILQVFSSKREFMKTTALFQFEAAVTQQPENAEAWSLIGMAQSENEQEAAAIAALRKALALNPNDRQAMLSLGLLKTFIPHDQ